MLLRGFANSARIAGTNNAVSEMARVNDTVAEHTYVGAAARGVLFVAVVVAACLALFGCVEQGRHDEGNSPAALSGSAISEGEDASNDDKASLTPTDQSSASTPTDQSSASTSRVLDLNSHEDATLVNTFVSDFAKVWGRGFTFDAEGATTVDYLKYATEFCQIDDADSVEHKSNYGLYDVQGEGEGALEGYRMRIEAELAQKLVQQHFGVDVNFADVSAPQLHQCQYQDGYVYFGGAQGYTAKAIARCSSLELQENGTYCAYANVYDVVTARYDPNDESYYSCSREDLEANPVLEGTYSPGTIVFEDVGDGALRLVSYDVRSSSARIEAPAYEGGEVQGGDPSKPVRATINSSEEARDYIIERLNACGKRVPQKVECQGVGERGYTVRGVITIDRPNEYRDMSVFTYEVRPDGSIYDVIMQTMVNPQTMEQY